MAYEQKNLPKHKKDFRRNYELRDRKEETPEEKFQRLFDNWKLDVIRSGVLKKYKEKEYHMKPGEKRRYKEAEARAKAKQNRKRRLRGK